MDHLHEPRNEIQQLSHEMLCQRFILRIKWQGSIPLRGFEMHQHEQHVLHFSVDPVRVPKYLTGRPRVHYSDVCKKDMKTVNIN
ncbi:hypothetical protein CHS0354_020021, partial [Potamilus streckersoni]